MKRIRVLTMETGNIELDANNAADLANDPPAPAAHLDSDARTLLDRSEMSAAYVLIGHTRAGKTILVDRLYRDLKRST